MSLLKYIEKINTDCSRLEYLILNTKAIKIDAQQSNSLKNSINCSHFKSCDYIRKKRDALYFIEVSDLIYEIHNYEKTGLDNKQATKKSKEGIRLKLSDSIHIYNELVQKFKIDESKIIFKKVLIALCHENPSDVIAFRVFANSLEQHYKPILYSSIKVIPYTELENIFSLK